MIALEPGRLGDRNRGLRRCSSIALCLQSTYGVAGEDQRIGAQSSEQERFGAREQRYRRIVTQRDETFRDLVEQLQGLRQVTEIGMGTCEIMAGLERGELLADRAIQNLRFLIVGDRTGQFAATHPDAASVGEYACHVERSAFTTQPGERPSNRCNASSSLPASLHSAARLQLGCVAQVAGAELLDDVELAERSGPTPRDGEHAGECQVGVSHELVVVGLLRHGDRFVEGLLGEFDLAEHAPGPAEHGLGAAEARPVLAVARVVRDPARFTRNVGRIAADRGGKCCQAVHRSIVGIGLWARTSVSRSAPCFDRAGHCRRR